MRPPLILAVLFLLAVVTVLVAPLVGMDWISPSALFGLGDDPVQIDILWKIRIPRTALAMLAGVGLAASGLVFQAMFRNPLAEPFTLGVSSGASLGAALCILMHWDFSFWMFRGVTLFAFAGTLLAIGVVYGLTRLRGGFSAPTMLLAGGAVSFFFSSLILVLQYFSDFLQTFRMLRWVMGGLDAVVGYQELFGVLPFVAGGCVIVYAMAHELNLLTTGEDLAASRGMAVERTKIVLFLLSSLMVGAVVAACGPIGFVGLMVPHICRLLIGPDHRWLVPATLLFGGVFLAWCDTLSRTLLAPTELPVGIITALLGGPFFLWLLVARAPEAGGD